MSQKSPETENTFLINFKREQVRARPDLITYYADSLVDRNCVLLDGKCDCPRPVYDSCKYLKNKV